MDKEKQYTKISKFLSLILRHKPETIALSLDEQGWAEVTTLLNGVNEKGIELDMETLKNIVDTNSKKRFAFNDDYSKIRASQGHSLQVDLGYEAKEPPILLYHGTSDKVAQTILIEGIKKQSRQHVHLSTDVETAQKVGSRHGKPVVLEIASAKMCKEGYVFFISENGVWLTDYVPPQYCSVKG